ncbi:Protein kinase domain [Carpediemonas membranifera]|uniref:Protein kinase domain n=1 Tax=Carpediemonas membranifera TaxID=201153 RepID=A0A8J6B9Q4_9EUKA|nr:Protein kinase domain [Carpediemonas membranifera]|eukprot:KAG9395687.1 Protein kinase domain [Carpediemonas membranifera]
MARELVLDSSQRHLERYEKYSDSLFGVGRFKTVYRAFDHEEGIEVAWNEIQVAEKSDEEIKRLLSEIEIISSIEHPSIINFYDAWKSDDGNQVVFITEAMTSGTLTEYIKRVTRVKAIRPHVVKRWCRQVLSGLDYLHKHNPTIIHRDLSCANIFINGNNGEVKIGDLGLSTYLTGSNTSTSIGSPGFMAPELYEGPYDERVDIYSFGMCVLEMVTGQVPWAECTNTVQIYNRVINDEKPDVFDTIPPGPFRSMIELCLMPQSARPTAAELLASHFLDDDPGSPCSQAIASPTYQVVNLTVHIERQEDGERTTSEISFPFDTRQDTPLSVAGEMAREFELDTGTPMTLQFAECIQHALRKTIEFVRLHGPDVELPDSCCPTFRIRAGSPTGSEAVYSPGRGQSPVNEGSDRNGRVISPQCLFPVDTLSGGGSKNPSGAVSPVPLLLPVAQHSESLSSAVAAAVSAMEREKLEKNHNRSRSEVPSPNRSLPLSPHLLSPAGSDKMRVANKEVSSKITHLEERLLMGLP